MPLLHLLQARERLARLKDAEETGTLAQMPGEYTGVAGAGGAAGAATSLDIREPSAAAMELDRIAEMAIAAADAAFRHVPVMGGSLQVCVGEEDGGERRATCHHRRCVAAGARRGER